MHFVKCQAKSFRMYPLKSNESIESAIRFVVSEPASRYNIFILITTDYLLIEKGILIFLILQMNSVDIFSILSKHWTPTSLVSF